MKNNLGEMPPLDVERKFFGQLPEDERKTRIVEAGEENAVRQYGNELAGKSLDIEKELSPEEREKFEQLKKSASGILKSFRFNPANNPEQAKITENLVIVVESTVDELVRQAFYEEGRNDFKDECRMVVVSELENSGATLPEEVRQKMLAATNILLLGVHSMSHSSATKEAWYSKRPAGKGVPGKEAKIEQWFQQRQQAGKMLENEDGSPRTFPDLSEDQLNVWYKMFSSASIISIPDAYPESFMHECYEIDKREIALQVHKIEKLFKNSKSARITSPSGTDVLVEFDHSKYEVFAEEPNIGRDEGLNFMNVPSGETCLRPANINGRFVIDGFCADNPLEVDNDGNVLYPITIDFKDGGATIQPGSPAADRLIEMCEIAKKSAADDGKYRDPYQAAEFAIGVLGRPNKEGKINFTLNNATIDEKLSVHVAIGKDDVLGGSNEVEIHIDFGGQFVSVELLDNLEGKENENTIQLMKDGKLLLDEKGELIKE